MFLGEVGKTAKVVSKLTGGPFKVWLLAKSDPTPKKVLFIISGKSVVWRDSIRRRYNVK